METYITNNQTSMTPIEALIVFKTGWSTDDPLSKQIIDKADKVINEEYARIYLEAKKDQLERELSEVNKKITMIKTPF